MFPPLDHKAESETLTEYTSFNYWRDTLPDLQEELENLKREEEERKKLEKAKKPSSPKSPQRKNN